MNSEIQNLINEKQIINNRIKARRERFKGNEEKGIKGEIDKLREEYFTYNSNDNAYRSRTNERLEREIERENENFEKGLKEEFEQELLDINSKLKAERDKLVKTLDAKKAEYQKAYHEMIISFRNQYTQVPLEMPNLDEMQKEIDEIQNDIKAIEQCINTNGIDIADVQIDKTEEPKKEEPKKDETSNEMPEEKPSTQEPSPAQAEPVQTQEPSSAQAEPEQTNPEPSVPTPEQTNPTQQGSSQGKPAQAKPAQEPAQKKSLPKVKISKFIDTEVNGQASNKGVADYSDGAKIDIRLMIELKDHGFDEKATKMLMDELSANGGDKNVMIALLEMSKDGTEATRYIDDYLSTLKGDKEKLSTFELEYDLTKEEDFSKQENKKISEYAMKSYDFSKITASRLKLLGLRLRSLKIVKAVTLKFKKFLAKISNTKMIESEKPKTDSKTEKAPLSERVEKLDPTKTPERTQRQEENTRAQNSRDEDKEI